MTRYSWTQPICGDCYSTRNPGREPVRLKDPDEEQCVYCGLATAEGIYTRIDPDYAPYPSLKKDEPEAPEETEEKVNKQITIIECEALPKVDYLGNSAERTDEKIETIGKRFFRSRAIAYAKRNRPLTPFYHLRVEKVAGRWEINVYQNKLVSNEPDHPRG